MELYKALCAQSSTDNSRVFRQSTLNQGTNSKLKANCVSKAVLWLFSGTSAGIPNYGTEKSERILNWNRYNLDLDFEPCTVVIDAVPINCVIASEADLDVFAALREISDILAVLRKCSHTVPSVAYCRCSRSGRRADQGWWMILFNYSNQDEKSWRSDNVRLCHFGPFLTLVLISWHEARKIRMLIKQCHKLISFITPSKW